MPESHGRAKAEQKKQQRQHEAAVERRKEREAKTTPPGNANRWVVPGFIITGLLGVFWLLMYYIVGDRIDAIGRLGVWNVVIGISLFMASFVIMSFWK